MRKSFITESVNAIIGYELMRYVLLEMFVIAGGATYAMYVQAHWSPVATFLITFVAMLVVFAVRTLELIYTLTASAAWSVLLATLVRVISHIYAPKSSVDWWGVLIAATFGFFASYAAHEYAQRFVRVLEGQDPV